MVVALTNEQESALAALVAAGDFASVEEAARVLLDERLAERDVEEAEFERTKALIAEAEADFESGAVMTFEEHRTQIEALLASLG